MVGPVGTHDRIMVDYRGLDVENLIDLKLKGEKAEV
jgi:hypothetical protein